MNVEKTPKRPRGIFLEHYIAMRGCREVPLEVRAQMAFNILQFFRQEQARNDRKAIFFISGNHGLIVNDRLLNLLGHGD